MDEMISTRHAAALLGVTRSTVVRWCQSGKLAGAYLPRRSRKLGYRVPRAVAMAMLEPRERQAIGEQAAT